MTHLNVASLAFRGLAEHRRVSGSGRQVRYEAALRGRSAAPPESQGKGGGRAGVVLRLLLPGC